MLISVCVCGCEERVQTHTHTTQGGSCFEAENQQCNSRSLMLENPVMLRAADFSRSNLNVRNPNFPCMMPRLQRTGFVFLVFTTSACVSGTTRKMTRIKDSASRKGLLTLTARRVSLRYGPNSDAVKASIPPHVADISCEGLIALPPSSLLFHRFCRQRQHFFRRGVGIIRGQFGLGCLDFEWEMQHHG